MDLLKMSLSELKAIKQEWYIEANDNGNILKLATICRKLGEKVFHNYGPKYLLNHGAIEIYVDDYGNYMLVKENGKLKVSTHNERLYVKGAWENIITELWAKVEPKIQYDQLSKEEQERIKLLEQLT